MEQDDLLRLVAQTLDRLEIPYAITGSMACIVYGEPRQTHDIDVVIRLRPDQVPAICAAFPAPEFYVSPEAARQAVRECAQFNVIHAQSALKIDFIVAGKTPLDQSRMQRVRRIRIGPDPGGEPSFMAPEDVIIKKLDFYREGGSDKHLSDIAKILKTMGDQLDRTYIQQWADRLEVADIWRIVQERAAFQT